ncbi:MAG: hypothetical protein P9L99_04710 [Candidatus Lernaella stagnicola]|nr:hypothetical protein [Candidatus Lernaella stagnicola]
MLRNRLFLAAMFLLLIAFILTAACATGGGDDDDDDDGGVWDDDDDAGDDDDDDDAMSVADARDESEGSVVTVEGVVISPLNWSGDLFFIQDEDSKDDSSGIAVYMWDQIADGYDGEIGDVVRVTGQIAVFYDLMEIVCENEGGSVEVVGSGAEPDPTTIDIDEVGDDYEGMLVEITDVDVIADPDEYGEFTVEDGNSDQLNVDDLFFEKDHWADEGIGSGDSYSSIVGVLNYDYGAWKIEPRSNSDLTE